MRPTGRHRDSAERLQGDASRVGAMAGAERFPQEIHITARLDHLEYRGPAVRRPIAGSELLYPQRLIRTTDP